MAAKTGGSGLLDAIRAQAEANRPGGKCTIGRLLSTMDATDAAELRAAIADDTISAQAIASVLTDRGWAMSHGPVQRHRRGGCSCDHR